MKMKSLVAGIIMVLCFANVPSQIAAQNTGQSVQQPTPAAPLKDEITPEELAQAQNVADHFIERLRQTRDLTPLIDEMFTAGFKKHLANDTSWSGIVGTGRSLVEHLDEQERVKCYAVQFTLGYLELLYMAGKYSLKSINRQSADIVPQKLTELFKDNAALNGEVKTSEQARQILSVTEQALAIMQEAVKSNPPEETAQFKENLKAFQAHLDEHKEEKPTGQVYTEERFGMPAGSRVVRVVIPFHMGLVLVKERGAFRIDLALIVIPPD